MYLRMYVCVYTDKYVREYACVYIGMNLVPRFNDYKLHCIDISIQKDFLEIIHGVEKFTHVV